MKKIIAICMAALLLLAALPVSLVLADGEFKIIGTVDKANACVGDTVTLTVTMENNPGLVGWIVDVDYDNTALKLVKQEKGAAFDGVGALSFGPMDKNSSNALWYDFLSPTNYTNNGVLFTFTFEVIEGAADGKYDLTVYCSDYDNLCDKDFNSLAVTFESTSVNVGHSYDNACDTTCNSCNAVRVVEPHPYEDAVTKPEDCGNDGVKTYTCPICGDNYTEAIPATGNHTYDNACDASCNVCGGTREVPAHNYVETDAKAEDCGNDGYKAYKCSECGAEKKDTIPATGNHTYDNACDADCNVCGGTRTPADHVYKDDCDADCNECGATREAPHSYTYACDKLCALCGELTNAAAEHKIVAMEAVDPGCHYIGNIAYWYCAHCGSVWTNEELTEVSNMKNVLIPALGGDVIHVEAKEATEDAEGNIEYWFCEKCEQFWTDEALTQLTNSKNVITPKKEAQTTTTTEAEKDDTTTTVKGDATTTKPAGESDSKDPGKTGENVAVVMVAGMIAMIAAAAVVLFSKKKA